MIGGDNTQEVWKDIIGYEGLYQISNLSRVKYLAHLDGRNYRIEASILSQKLKDECPKFYVRLKKDNKEKYFRVEALHYATFILGIDANEYVKSDRYLKTRRIKKTKKVDIILNKLKEDLIENYATKNADYFARKHNRSIEFIRMAASKLKLTSRYQLEALKPIIIEEYAKNRTPLKQLQKKYGHCVGTYKKMLEKEGIIIRNNAESKKQYEWKESYFEKIDTHEKAYWLGFIYADGNIRKKGGGDKLFQICLASKDWGYVEQLKKCLQSTHPIYNDKGAARIIISQPKIYDDLFRLGVHPNKSLTCKFPNKKQLPELFINSFILGYFDGDGSISITSKYSAHISIIGTKSFIHAIKRNLIIKNGISGFHIRQEKRSGDGKLFYLNTWAGKNSLAGKEKLKKIYDYLYKDVTIALNRKQDRFKEVLGL